MITTTLNRIRAHGPCLKGWSKLLAGLGKAAPDDEPLPFTRIIEINGLDDALWCCRAEPQYAREWRLFAVWCARQVEYLMTDPRSKDALVVAERHANGKATNAELAAASDAASAAEDAAASAAISTRAVARAAASAAEDAAARGAAWAGAWAARAARGAAWAARDAASAGAWAASAASAASAAAWAARDAARDAQKAEFLRVVTGSRAALTQEKREG